MRNQAKKMNVQSLRSGDNQNINAEVKLAKVCVREEKYVTNILCQVLEE